MFKVFNQVPLVVGRQSDTCEARLQDTFKNIEIDLGISGQTMFLQHGLYFGSGEVFVFPLKTLLKRLRSKIVKVFGI
jgi:hypothetical protein